MSFQREGIQNVRAVMLPDGIGADGRFVGLSRTALLTWQSSLAGMVFQAYMNGQFVGATTHPDQRQLVVQAPASFDVAVHVEVVAVSPTEAHIDFRDRIAGPNPDRQRVTLTLLRSQELPAGASVNVYSDGGGGEIDYSTPVNSFPIPVWPCPRDKAGFGTTAFGSGDFGFDSAGAVGFGRGCFGLGEFGVDADAIQWVSPILGVGTYRFGVVVADEHGNTSTPIETPSIVVTPPAKPAASLDIETFDPQANRLTLRISDHARA